jgi:hypothetical protein
MTSTADQTPAMVLSRSRPKTKNVPSVAGEPHHDRLPRDQDQVGHEKRPLLDAHALGALGHEQRVEEAHHLHCGHQRHPPAGEARGEEQSGLTTAMAGPVRSGRRRTHSLVVARVCTARTAW